MPGEKAEGLDVKDEPLGRPLHPAVRYLRIQQHVVGGVDLHRGENRGVIPQAGRGARGDGLGGENAPFLQRGMRPGARPPGGPFHSRRRERPLLPLAPPSTSVRIRSETPASSSSARAAPDSDSVASPQAGVRRDADRRSSSGTPVEAPSRRRGSPGAPPPGVRRPAGPPGG